MINLIPITRALDNIRFFNDALKLLTYSIIKHFSHEKHAPHLKFHQVNVL